MNIQNPFKLFDHANLDYVYNPIAWQTEHYFGVSAPRLGTYASLVALAMFLVGGFIFQDIILVLFGTFICYSRYTDELRNEKYFTKNTKTGLNRLREDSWVPRVFLQVIMLIMVLMLVFATKHETAIEALAMAFFCIGFYFLTVVPAYFSSCDTLPPDYKQSVVSQAA